MAISAVLIGADSPRKVQITVSPTPSGEAWTLTGTAAGVTWQVPGGSGVGDGQQLVRVDTRTPLNTPIVYTFTAATSGAQSAAAVTVTSAYSFIIQTLDGTITVAGDMLADSSQMSLDLQQSVFKVPGRERPVVRYDVTGDGGGAFNVGLEMTLTSVLRSLVRSGAPVVIRRAAMDDDLPLVAVVLLTGITSSGLAIDIGYRLWALPYVLLDDPFADVALGAFTWDQIDTLMAGRTWTQMETVMAGRTWNQIDALDWSTV